MSLNINKIKQKIFRQALILLYKKAELYHQLVNVNLALSNVCGAKCIFCPQTRAKNKEIKIMPLDYAKKISDEISDKKSKTIRSVRKINVGENGDALLNPNFIEILRYIRLKNPKIVISLFTNFQNMTRDVSEVLFKENLVNFVGVNIDGHDAESYFRVKRIPYEVVKQNLTDFLQTRKQFNSNAILQVFILTYSSYVKTIYNKLGTLPTNIDKSLNIETLKDDYVIINHELEKMLNPKTDVITRSGVYLWAERENIELIKSDNSTLKCPNILRVKNECFIAPNGDWYACCWDELQRLTFGNVIQKSIHEVYNGEQRKIFINLLKQKKFDKIGYPCNKIVACQPLTGEI